jgi:hypothetical protein
MSLIKRPYSEDIKMEIKDQTIMIYKVEAINSLPKVRK